MEKKLLPYLVLVSALSVSLSAAFYSVLGIGMLFSGASTQAMVMMSSLEVAKLVTASLLYQYWTKINAFLKMYYFIAVFVLMGLTSAGIYGYLSSAYSQTSNKVENVDRKVKVLDLKRDLFNTQLTDVRKEKSSINDNISDLTKGLSNNVIEVMGRDGQIRRTTSSANRKSYESQLESARKRRDDIITKEISLSDSISSIDIQKLNLETDTELAGEIGPLKYIAKLTNKSIDVVVNWFIVALMLVFDPLAISLVIGVNIIFKDRGKEKEKEKASNDMDNKIILFKEREKEIDDLNIDIDNRTKEIEERESSFSNKEKELEDMISSKEKEIEEMLEKERKELEKVKGELDLKEEDLLKREEDNRVFLENKSKLESEIELLRNEKRELLDLKKKIDNDKDSLEDRENKLEEAKKDLLKLDSEIKTWEASHWKMRRSTKPPSSI